MRLLLNRKLYTTIALSALGLLPLGSAALSETQQQGYQVLPPIQSATTLQVTGSPNKFSILADHADVRSALKLIFDQADRQFDLDPSANALVTLRLTNQPLDTTLSAVCKQSFLRYTYDAKTEIYTFARDVDAVRVSIAQMQSLDAQLLDQLRSLGLAVPIYSYNALQNGQNGVSYLRGGPGDQLATGGRGGFGGGFGGGGQRGFGSILQQQPAGATGSAAPLEANRDRRAVAPARDLQGTPKGDAALNRSAAAFADKPTTMAKIQQNALGMSAGRAGGAPGANVDGAASQQYRVSNFVQYASPQNQAQPVRDIIEQLAAQNNVPVLFDDAVPKGSKFRARVNMTARPLADALNILCPPALLEWRMVGDSIFVTTTPDFEIFYGDSTQPRIIYGMSQDVQRLPQSNTKAAATRNAKGAKTNADASKVQPNK